VSASPARLAAFEVVRRVTERTAYGPETLAAVLSEAEMTARDVALTTRLAYGALQYSGTLDETIDRYVERPERLAPEVRDALRVACYELLFSRTPARAAVSQGVDLVRSTQPKAAGLANAVLRRISEAAADFPWGDPETDDAALARATGHPRWLVDELIGEYGRDAASAILTADDEPAPLYLWHNPLRGSMDDLVAALEADGARPQLTPFPECVRAESPPAAVRSRALVEGRAAITDAAAQVAALAVGAHPGGVVVDLASGRGSKTAQLQALSVAAGAPARIFAVDIHDFKVRELRRRMAVLGVPDVVGIVADATDIAGAPGMPALGTAQAVLLDAPCTGTGTLRRHPEKRWRLTSEDPARLARLQAAMLSAAASLAAPGVVVVYTTCSILRTENAAVIESFLATPEGASFSVQDLAPILPETWRSRVTSAGMFASVPEADGPDGHFVAALRRRGV
jgi:16S rRNA (cytosine967-C5)-methyltransferase